MATRPGPTTSTVYPLNTLYCPTIKGRTSKSNISNESGLGRTARLGLGTILLCLPPYMQAQ